MNEHAQPSNSQLAPLVYNGEVIHQRDEMLSLTDMWKSAGKVEGRGPSDWRGLPASKAFIEHVELTTGKSGSLFSVKEGRSGGTWAHWQVALAYAKYLSPEFHMWCNQVVRDRMEGKTATALTLPPDVIELLRRTDGICRMLSHKVTEMEKVQAGMVAGIQSELAVVLGNISPTPQAIQLAVQSELARQHFVLRRGKTAGQIYLDNRFPPIKNIAAWLGHRLVKAGCRIADNGCVELGVCKARLFDPDKAQQWIDELGGRQLFEQKIAARLGQKSFHLVPMPAKPTNPTGGFLATLVAIMVSALTLVGQPHEAKALPVPTIQEGHALARLNGSLVTIDMTRFKPGPNDKAVVAHFDGTLSIEPVIFEDMAPWYGRRSAGLRWAEPEPSDIRGTITKSPRVWIVGTVAA